MPAAPPAHVPVVEDDADSLSLCLRHLRGCGFAVSGAAALEQARFKRPNAVLLDLGLPDMDGMQVLRSQKAGALTRQEVARLFGVRRLLMRRLADLPEQRTIRPSSRIACFAGAGS